MLAIFEEYTSIITEEYICRGQLILNVESRPRTKMSRKTKKRTFSCPISACQVCLLNLSGYWHFYWNKFYSPLEILKRPWVRIVDILSSLWLSSRFSAYQQVDQWQYDFASYTSSNKEISSKNHSQTKNKWENIPIKQKSGGKGKGGRGDWSVTALLCLFPRHVCFWQFSIASCVSF